MRKTFALALAIAMLATTAVGSVGARELKISTWLPPRSIEGRMYEDFVKDLAKTTNGSLTARVFHGGQLLSAGATLSGIRDGVVDAGFIVPTIYASELKHTVVVQNLMHHVTDPYVAAGAAMETIMVDCPECQGDFAKQNTVYLGGHAGTGWNLMCTSPTSSLNDIKGKKVRVTGRSATRMVAALGMVAVNLTPAELAPALQGGQINCAMGYKAWMIDYSLLDTIKSVVDFSLGSYSGLGFMTMNKRSFDSLTPAERKALLDLQPEYATRGIDMYAAQDKLAFERGKAKGIKFVDASPDFVAAFEKFRNADVPNVVADLKAQGVADPAKLAQQHLATIEKWNKLVKAEGSTRAGYLGLLQREIYDKAKF
jgi:TRAP-type C4-dicarboxylate transport system substrate-binding protein